MENEFLKVVMDPPSGAIRHLIDKAPATIMFPKAS